MPLFSRPGNEKSKLTEKVSELKNDRALFSRLYIACQRRKRDLAELFRHETQLAPPSLPDKGNIRQGDKFHLLECMEKDVSIPEKAPPLSAKIFDGPAVVLFLPPGTATTFGQYASEVFLPYVLRELNSPGTSRVDIVWDVYLHESFKTKTRGKRGEGTLRRVATDTRILTNWSGFLRNDENKKDLFRFLHQSCTGCNSQVIISTTEQSVISFVKDMDNQGLEPCSQEEADKRVVLHARHAALCGHEKVMIRSVRSVDTDVAVIATSCFYSTRLQELWLAFGTGQKFRWIAIHEIVAHLGPAKSTGLCFFHAFTGCDNVSFLSRGKKSAWQTWESYPEVTDTFVKLSTQPEEVTQDLIARLERFVVLLYDRTSALEGVDGARMYLFTKRCRELENIPPTSAALKEHIQRAAYQAGYIWGQALTTDTTVPSPSDWGWKMQDGRWTPVWIRLEEAAKACYELPLQVGL